MCSSDDGKWGEEKKVEGQKEKGDHFCILSIYTLTFNKKGKRNGYKSSLSSA